VEESLVKVRNAGTEQDLGIQYKALKPEVDKLNMMSAKRQQVRTEQSWRYRVGRYLGGVVFSRSRLTLQLHR